MKDPISKEDLESIKANCLIWSNNCGGCETCAQFFGDKEPPYDHQETYQLIVMIEARDQKISELEEKLNSLLPRLENGKDPQIPA